MQLACASCDQTLCSTCALHVPISFTESQAAPALVMQRRVGGPEQLFVHKVHEYLHLHAIDAAQLVQQFQGGTNGATMSSVSKVKWA